MGDSMVLQRGKPVALGFGAPGGADCSAQLDGSATPCGSASAAADGSWRIALSGGATQHASASGVSHTLTVRCGPRGENNTLTALDVVFGDVYVTSGERTCSAAYSPSC